MTQQKTQYSATVQEILRVAVLRGRPIEEVSRELIAMGVKGASFATVARRMAEIRQGVNASRPVVAAPTLPSDVPLDPGALPEGASVAELATLRSRCKAALDTAEGDGDLKLVGQLIRVQAALEELIRKATPARVPDPNDDPDVRAMGAAAVERLHQYIEHVSR